MSGADVMQFIQWPILAAFLGVIYFVGKFFVEKAKQDAEHAREKEKQAAEFIQQMAMDGMAAYKAHAAASQEQTERIVAVVEENNRARERDARAMFAIVEAVEQRNKREFEEHELAAKERAVILARLESVMAVTEK